MSRRDTLRTVWHFSLTPAEGWGTSGRILEERIAHYRVMRHKRARLRFGPKGLAVRSLYLWNITETL